MQKKIRLLYTGCKQQFNKIVARFARRLFVLLLLNLFRCPCF